MKKGFFAGVLALALGLSSLNAEKPAGETPGSNGLPNVSSRFHPDSTGIDIFADLLVWCAKESGTEAWAQVLTSSGTHAQFDLRAVDFEWNAGFRVGVGYGMRHDQWDTQLYYTWFHTHGDGRASGGPGTVHSSFLGNFYVDNTQGAGLSGPAYQNASIRWAIRFNMFDWELGRSFWVSKALSLRPFVGLKGGWIHQKIHSTWQTPNLPASEFFNTATENLKNNFWGIGPCGGLNTKWMLFTRPNHTFSLFGDFSAAIMYGQWTFGDRYRNDIQQEIVIRSSHLKSGATMARGLMGFGWDAKFCQGRYQFSTKLGYEMQFWLDQLQFYSFDIGRLSNELTLQGGTLELRFDF